MIPAIFKNPLHQEKFDREGFIVLPFLDKERVAILDRVFDELHPQVPEGGFISGSYSADFDYKKKASDIIVEHFSESYDRIFKDYTAFGGAFLYKVPSENSELVAHQDWTIVDENKFVAINCWVPLCDINSTNGALHVLPGSHFKNHPVHRAPTLPFFFKDHEELLKAKLIPQYVKAGEAVILNQSLVHYSPPNRSDNIRKAITAGIKSKGAPMQFFYNDLTNENNQLEIFSQDEDFLIRFDDFAKDIFERPKLGESQDKINYKVPTYDEEALIKLLDRMLHEAGYKKVKKNLFQRIKSAIHLGS